MTKEQVNKLLAMIVGAYPYLTKEWDPSYMSSLWTYLFSDLTYEEVTQALMDYLRTSTSGYPPNPAQLRDLVLRRKEPPELSEAEAWHLISRAVQRSTYYSGEEFRKLPPILQRVVGSPSNLHEWAFSDGQYFRNNLFPWFIRSYRQALETQKASAALPEARPFRLPGEDE